MILYRRLLMQLSIKWNEKGGQCLQNLKSPISKFVGSAFFPLLIYELLKLDQFYLVKYACSRNLSH